MAFTIICAVSGASLAACLLFVFVAGRNIAKRRGRA